MRALNDDSNDVEIPLTSVLDIVFLLLIFFMVATNFTRREIDQQVRLPETETGGSGRSGAPERLVLNVREDGSVVVDGARLDAEGLRLRLREWRAASPDRPAVIRGDGRASYQSVMRVLGACRSEGVRLVDLPVIDLDPSSTEVAQFSRGAGVN